MIRILLGAVLAFGGLMVAVRGVVDGNNVVAALGGLALVGGLLVTVTGVER